MIGMVIVTHGGLAREFRLALEHVVGPQSQLETISIGPEDDMERRRADILTAVAAVDRGDGVVLLTDMFGGTPSNLAISVMDDAQIKPIGYSQRYVPYPPIIPIAPSPATHRGQRCTPYRHQSSIRSRFLLDRFRL